MASMLVARLGRYEKWTYISFGADGMCFLYWSISLITFHLLTVVEAKYFSVLEGPDRLCHHLQPGDVQESYSLMEVPLVKP